MSELVSNALRPVGCVIMASGRSTRFGSNKLLADFEGQPLIARALDATATHLLLSRVVVTRSPEVAQLSRGAGVETVLHELPGRNDTVRLGLEALLDECPGLAGCMFLPGDQPLLRRTTVEAMVWSFLLEPHNQKETEQAIYRLGYQGPNDPRPLAGSPVLFGSSYFQALLTLPEGKGGSVLLEKYAQRVHTVCTTDPAELRDVDTPEDLAACAKR